MVILNSSMPRSGSTLLQNILAQNPAITSSPTSLLGELVSGLRALINQSPSVRAEGYLNVIPRFKEFIKGGIDAWHKMSLLNSDAQVYIDKSRCWMFEKKLLEDIYGTDYKIICIVRNLRDVVASMEKNHRKNIYRSDHIENNGSGNLTQRVTSYLNTVPVSPFLNKVVDVIQCNDTKNIIFVKYEALIANPQCTMDAIYASLGMDSYQHDFDNIPQSTHEDDEFHGIYGQHVIKSKLEDPNKTAYFDDKINKLIDETAPFYQSFFGYTNQV